MFDGEDLSEDGFLYSIGADYKVTGAISLGLEYTKQDFKDVMEDEIGTGGIYLDADLIRSAAGSPRRCRTCIAPRCRCMAT